MEISYNIDRMYEGVQYNAHIALKEFIYMSKNTYISLFSSAGVGCYGFKMSDFDCIATLELIERRLNIQRYNSKCKYESGYICGDITKSDIKTKLYDEIVFWKLKEKINDIDVVIATPPCQGMSVANHKKSKNEIIRNSLVIESINIIKNIMPKFFVFENVPAFMKTICTDNDKIDKSIENAIQCNLGERYKYISKVLNFKNYGSNSSRTRTLVIGVRNDIASFCSPFDFFPDYNEEHTLREVIGDLMSLNEPYEFDPNDIYHFFRNYDQSMRGWISCLKEGESAFDNPNIENRPHQVINGEIVENVRKNGDKYTRQFWDKVGPCIHTRNDQLASQNTIHPKDDRVFSIRELMRLMSIPETFNWTNKSIEELNKLNHKDKISFLKKEEINIRQSIGEAVPTNVFYQIAQKIKSFLNKKNLTPKEIIKIITDNKLDCNGNIVQFVKNNVENINFTSLCKVIEYSNAQRNEQSAYYTDKFLIDKIYEFLPEFDEEEINILEPSVGAGNFIPAIISKYSDKKIVLDLIDIDGVSISTIQILLKKYENTRIKINYIVSDFIDYRPKKTYDLVVGNPPFTKISKKNIFLFEKNYFYNFYSSNLSSYFLEKACNISKNVSMIMPKNLLNTPEYKNTRDFLSNFNVKSIIDFGENGFKGVLVETLCLNISTKTKASKTLVYSITKNLKINQSQKYIFDSKLPYWIIYRNKNFDDFYSNMNFNIFSVFRDRQITSSKLNDKGNKNFIRVIKSRNISDDGKSIIDIDGYDGYLDESELEELEVAKYLDRDDVFLTPNMTYKTRVMKKEKGYVVNGSVAILIPNSNITITDEDLLYFSSLEYRDFMQIARNYQTRSLNIDANSVYFFGVKQA